MWSVCVCLVVDGAAACNVEYQLTAAAAAAADGDDDDAAGANAKSGVEGAVLCLWLSFDVLSDAFSPTHALGQLLAHAGRP